MDKYLIIVTDINDADYQTVIRKNVGEEFEQLIYRLVEAIKIVNNKKKHHYNWPMSEHVGGAPINIYGEYLTEEEIMWICDEIHVETHTIQKIYFLHVHSKEELLFI